MKGALFVGEWWLAAAILVTALLTSMAIIRVWLFAFWRGGPQGTRDGAEAWTLPELRSRDRRLALGSIVLLLAATVVLGLMPEYLSVHSGEAARALLSPDAAGGYIESVFGGSQ